MLQYYIIIVKVLWKYLPLNTHLINTLPSELNSEHNSEQNSEQIKLKCSLEKGCEEFSVKEDYPQPKSCLVRNKMKESYKSSGV